MAYKEYALADLALMSGRPVASYTPFALDSAIPQALLLFKIGTCLAAPDDLSDDQKKLVDYAVISMAESIYLAQPFARAVASPFNSETIGAYSYSKTAKAVAAGLPTGVMWFDMAITQLSVCDELAGGDIAFGGIEVFENLGYFTQGSHGQNIRYLAPSEVALSTAWGYDPTFR